MEYSELEKCTVGKLREMLKEQDPDVKGASSMKKAELVEALAAKMGLEAGSAPAAEAAPKKAPAKKAAKKPAKKKPQAPREKAVIKADIKKAKEAKQAASGDKAKLAGLRVELHELRRELKRAGKKSA